MPLAQLQSSRGTWDSESGAFISSDHQRVAEIIHDYNPDFSLAWIPPKDRSLADTKPFAIVSRERNKPEHIIRYLSETEMKNPAEILAWLFEGDLSKHKPVDILKKIELKETARQLLELRQQEEDAWEREQLLTFMASGGNNKLNYFKHNGKKFER